jgi:hypothetical protein
LAKFFSPSGVDASVLMESILSGEIYGEDLNASNLQSIKLLSCIALMYIVNYIFEQIPQISQMIMSAFSVEENKKYGDEMADNLMVLSEDAFKIVTGVGKTILSGGKDKEDKKEGKKEDTPKEDKPKEDKGDKKGGK